MDLKKLTDDLWKMKSLPPSWLGKLTPYEFMTLFMSTRSDDAETTQTDALGELAKVNQERGRSRQLPFIPPSLLSDHNSRRPKVEPVVVPEPVGGMVDAAPMGPVRW